MLSPILTAAALESPAALRRFIWTSSCCVYWLSGITFAGVARYAFPCAYPTSKGPNLDTTHLYLYSSYRGLHYLHIRIRRCVLSWSGHRHRTCEPNFRDFDHCSHLELSTTNFETSRKGVRFPIHQNHIDLRRIMCTDHNHLPNIPIFRVLASLFLVDRANVDGLRFRKFALSDFYYDKQLEVYIDLTGIFTHARHQTGGTRK